MLCGEGWGRVPLPHTASLLALLLGDQGPPLQQGKGQAGFGWTSMEREGEHSYLALFTIDLLQVIQEDGTKQNLGEVAEGLCKRWERV